MPEKLECPVCAGTGKASEEVCSSCLGDGWVDELSLESIDPTTNEGVLRMKKRYAKITFEGPGEK